MFETNYGNFREMNKTHNLKEAIMIKKQLKFNKLLYALNKPLNIFKKLTRP